MKLIWLKTIKQIINLVSRHIIVFLDFQYNQLYDCFLEIKANYHESNHVINKVSAILLGWRSNWQSKDFLKKLEGI